MPSPPHKSGDNGDGSIDPSPRKKKKSKKKKSAKSQEESTSSEHADQPAVVPGPKEYQKENPKNDKSVEQTGHKRKKTTQKMSQMEVGKDNLPEKADAAGSDSSNKYKWWKKNKSQHYKGKNSNTTKDGTNVEKSSSKSSSKSAKSSEEQKVKETSAEISETNNPSSEMKDAKKKKEQFKFNFHRGQENVWDESTAEGKSQKKSDDTGKGSRPSSASGSRHWSDTRPENVQNEFGCGTLGPHGGDVRPLMGDFGPTPKFGPRQPRWFGKGRKQGRPYHRGRGGFWKPQWNRPRMDHGEQKWLQGPALTFNQMSNDFFNDNFPDRRNQFYHQDHGDRFPQSFRHSDHFQYGPMGEQNDEPWESSMNENQNRDWTHCTDSNFSEPESLPKRERSVSLTLDESKPPQTDLPLPKKDNTNVSLKAMQIIDQIVNKKSTASRESQQSSTESGHDNNLSQNAAARQSSTSATSKKEGTSHDTSQKNRSYNAQAGENRFPEKNKEQTWQRREFADTRERRPFWQGRRFSDDRSPSWEDRQPHWEGRQPHWADRQAQWEDRQAPYEDRQHPLKDSRGPAEPEKGCRYSAASLKFSSNEHSLPYAGAAMYPPMPKFSSNEHPLPYAGAALPPMPRNGSRSLSESHADDVGAQLKDSEKNTQPRQGSKFKISLPKTGKPSFIKSGPLNKDYLTKLVNSPRSRKEQIQVAKMLKTHTKQHRPSVHKPSLQLGEQSSEDKQSNVCMEELPDDIRAQISQLIETDMVISDEEVALSSNDIIALSSHDEDEDDDLDLIMLRDSPSPTPAESKVDKDVDPIKIQLKLEDSQKGKPAGSQIVIEDSDDEREATKPSKSSDSQKRRRSASESIVPSKKQKQNTQNTTDDSQENEPSNVLVIKPVDAGMDDMKILEKTVPATKLRESKPDEHPVHVLSDQEEVTPLIMKKGNEKYPAENCAASVTEKCEKSKPSPLVSSELLEMVSANKDTRQTVGEEQSPAGHPLSSALLPPLVKESAASALNTTGDCMGQMLELSLREEEIHTKLSEVNDAVEKLQNLLKKTKDQLHRRLKQRDKLMAEEDDLRSQRIALLKGAVEKRSSASKNTGDDTLAIPKVAVSEISSSTEAGSASECGMTQESADRGDTVPRRESDSREPPQNISDNLLPSLQSNCDKTVLSTPSTNASDDAVMSSMLEVSTKKENIEPDSTSVIHLKEPKNETESSVENSSQDLPRSDDVLNKLRDGKGLKYLGSLNVKDSSSVIKSLASNAGQSNQKIYTLSSADPLIPLSMRTQRSSTDSPERPEVKTKEPQKSRLAMESLDIKTEDSSQIVCKIEEPATEWETLLKEMHPNEFMSLGFASNSDDQGPEKTVSATESRSVESPSRLSDNTAKSHKEKKMTKRKQGRSDSAKNSACTSTEEDTPKRPTRRKQPSRSKSPKGNEGERSVSLTGEADPGVATKRRCVEGGEKEDDCSVAVKQESTDTQETDITGPPTAPVEMRGHLQTVHDIAIWGKWLITASEDQKVIRFDLGTLSAVKEYVGHSKGVQVVKVLKPTTDATDPVIYSGSYDNSIITWNFETGEQLGTWIFAHRVHCIDSNWDRMYIGLGDGRIICYALSSGRLSDSFLCSKAAIRTIKTTKEGSRRVLVVASSDCSITIRDAMSGLLMRTLGGHSKVPMCLQVANPLVYSGGADHTLQVHDLNNGDLMKCLVQKRVVTSLILSDDRLFVAGYEEVVKCYDVQSWDLLYVIHGIKKGVITSLMVDKRKLFIGRKNGALECVTLVKKAKYTCRFGQCHVPLISTEDLTLHVNEYHILPSQNVIRCLWNDCSQYIAKDKDALDHMKNHVSLEYPGRP